MTTRVIRPDEWSDPPPSVQREVIGVQPEGPATGPPVLFVPGFGQGAWVYAEHWLERTAGRGFPAYAMSLRGHGASGTAEKTTMRGYVHDVTQVAAGLPKQAVLVGHGAGALVVAMALARYPARAGVLVAPVFGGVSTALGLLRRNPAGTLPGLFGGHVSLRPAQLFSRSLPAKEAQSYTARLQRVPAGAQRQLLRRQEPETPVGAPPVLVAGSPDDRVVAAS